MARNTGNTGNIKTETVDPIDKTETFDPINAILESMAAELAELPVSEKGKATKGPKRFAITLGAKEAQLCASFGDIAPCVGKHGSAGWGNPGEPLDPGGHIGAVLAAAGTPTKHGSLLMVLCALGRARQKGQDLCPTFPTDASPERRWAILAAYLSRRSGRRFVLRRDGTTYLSSLKTAGSDGIND
jgi:hypothetical protein